MDGNLRKPAKPAKIKKELRRKRTARIFSVALVLAVFVGGLALSFSSLGRITAVEVRGAEGKVDPLLDAETDLVGDPILWTDTDRAKKRIEEIAWVQQAVVRKNLIRRTVTVEVVRRSPAAFARSDAGVVVLDASGVPFEITASASAGLLELTGDISPLTLGEVSTAASSIIWSAQSLSRWSKERFRSGGVEGGVIFLITDRGSEVRVGDSSNLDEKGRALRAMQERAAAEGWRVRGYNVVSPKAPALEKA